MAKNVVIAVLILIAIAEGVLVYKEHSQSSSMAQQMAMAQNTSKNTPPPAGPNARRKGGAPIMMEKGMNLKSSPLFKFAYQIAPGTPSSDATKAMTGWKIVSAKQTDGSLLVTLTPSDSDDQNQQYVVKTGQVLYFIEQTPVDDKAGEDKDLNYRDDYGIITDATGVVQ